MLFRTIVSAFFLDPSDRTDLAGLAAHAGMTEVAEFDALTRGALGFHEPGRQVLGGTWSAFKTTWAIVDDIDGLRCLQVYASATRYLEAARAAREQGDPTADGGPLHPYVQAFGDACAALNPRAAFLDTQPHHEDEDWVNKQGSRPLVLEQAPLVAAPDPDGLADRRFSLLYLNAELSALWTPGPHARDEVAMPRGRLIFARSGPSRMA